jgi:hypothetical protein
MKIKEEIKIVLGFESTKGTWRNKHTSKEFLRAEKLSKLVGEPLNRSANCSCIERFFIVLKILQRNNERIKLKQLQMKSNFELIEGKMIGIGGGHVTNANLTDEKAIEILTKYPAHIVTFKTVPANWKELCGKSEGEELSPREIELGKLEKDELYQMATAICEANESLTKPGARTGVPKLAKFVATNETPAE